MQDVEAVSQREEGDGEVDGSGVDGLPVRELVSCETFWGEDGA